MVSIKWTPPDPNWKSPASKGQNNLTISSLHLQTPPPSHPAVTPSRIAALTADKTRVDAGCSSAAPGPAPEPMGIVRSIFDADYTAQPVLPCPWLKCAAQPALSSSAIGLCHCQHGSPPRPRLSRTAACCTHVRRSIRRNHPRPYPHPQLRHASSLPLGTEPETAGGWKSGIAACPRPMQQMREDLPT